MPRVRAVLQARVSSSRLPGKALLPLAGIESALLAALRAGNRGSEVLLATSTHWTDDALVDAAERRNITVLRGDLSDVRSRFVAASADLDPRDIVVRLTGDNVFPDGDLVSRAVTSLEVTEARIARSMQDPRLPYGLSVEAFRVSTLRDSLRTDNDEARENVTPPIIAAQDVFHSFVPIADDHSDLRCTLDTWEDYRRLTAIFVGIPDPVGVSWRALLDRLIVLHRTPADA